MGLDRAKAKAVVVEVLDPQFLVADNDDVVVEPGLVDLCPGRLVHRLHVDAHDLGADLLTHQANFHRICFLRSTLPSLRREGLRYRADARMVSTSSAGVNKDSPSSGIQ